MSWREFWMTTLCHFIPFMRRFSGKRWLKAKQDRIYFVFDDASGRFSNEYLRNLGWDVLDYRKK